jgi:hypothetical protein
LKAKLIDYAGEVFENWLRLSILKLPGDVNMKILLAVALFLAVGGGTFFLWTLGDKNNKQIAAGAEKCYEQGEAFFNQKKYKEALWSYEEVNEFYSKPHTNWSDLAEEKEWVCRAYLNDWTPSKEKTVGDMRQLKPHLYDKYKTELISITPVAAIDSTGNTLAPVVLAETPGFTTTPNISAQAPSPTTTTADLTPTPAFTATPTDSNQTPTPTTTTVDLTPAPTIATSLTNLTPMPSPGT